MPTIAHRLSPWFNRKILGLALVGAVSLLLMACAASGPSAKSAVRPGMRPEAVTALLGEPAQRELFAPNRYVYFYTSGPYKERPLCFDKHRLVHVGPELLASWRKERLALATGSGSKDGSRDELSSKAKARVKATLKAERDARIAELERQVKPLPQSATSENLRLYRELLSLDPNNVRYQRKVAFYRERMAAQQAQKKRAARERREVVRNQRNKELRVYEGNDQIQIAIHELGGGELYLWVKNVSNAPLLLVASYYRLLDADDRPIALNVSSELQGMVPADGIAYGKLLYNAEKKPSRLILEHPKAGAAEKWFP